MKVQNENQHYLPKYRLKNSLEKTEIFLYITRKLEKLYM